MKNFFLNMQKRRFIIAAFAIAIGSLIGILLNNANLTNVNSMFKTIAGIGVFTVLWLHAKSFFSTDDLGNYYSRIYGAGFGLIYTSLIFWAFTAFYAGQSNNFFNITAFGTIFGTAIYNFIVNNYAGVEREHLIARKMLERQMEKDAIAKEERKNGVVKAAEDPNQDKLPKRPKTAKTTSVKK